MTKQFDIGAIKVSDGYFFGRREWKEPSATQTLRCESMATDVAFLHLHPELSSSNLKDALVELIENAKQKVFVVSFILTDENIVQALINKAAELKGRVYVVTCLDDERLRRALAEEDNVSKSTDRRQLDCRKRLTEGGVWLRGCEECHAKYTSSDDRVAIISTANFDDYSLTRGGETGIRFTLQQEVERIGRHFTRLWHQRCEWELVPGAEHTMAQRQKVDSPCRVIQPPEDISPVAIWTDGEEQHILKHLHRVIDIARKELLLATWDVMDIARDPSVLIRPLEKALQRGVTIRMLARRRNPSQRSRENMCVLADMGIEILGDSTNHSKGAIADGQVGVMFSANFDTNRGLTRGIEMGVVLDKTKALADFHDYLRFAMRRARDVLFPHPTHLELYVRFSGSTIAAWPLEKVLAVIADAACLKRFTAAANKGLVLFSKDDTETGVWLFAAAEEFSLTPNGTNSFVLKARPAIEDQVISAQRLASIWKKPGSDGPKIGFCPAKFEFLNLVGDELLGSASA